MVFPHITHPDVRICVALREFGSTRALAVAVKVLTEMEHEA